LSGRPTCLPASGPATRTLNGGCITATMATLRARCTGRRRPRRCITNPQAPLKGGWRGMPLPRRGFLLSTHTIRHRGSSPTLFLSFSPHTAPPSRGEPWGRGAAPRPPLNDLNASVAFRGCSLEVSLTHTGPCSLLFPIPNPHSLIPSLAPLKIDGLSGPETGLSLRGSVRGASTWSDQNRIDHHNSLFTIHHSLNSRIPYHVFPTTTPNP
jgi:hypothetical protein